MKMSANRCCNQMGISSDKSVVMVNFQGKAVTGSCPIAVEDEGRPLFQKRTRSRLPTSFCPSPYIHGGKAAIDF